MNIFFWRKVGVALLLNLLLWLVLELESNWLWLMLFGVPLEAIILATIDLMLFQDDELPNRLKLSGRPKLSRREAILLSTATRKLDDPKPMAYSDSVLGKKK